MMPTDGKRSCTMKQQVFAIMLVAAAAVFFNQPLWALEQKGPQIEIKETTYDFGKVVEGAKLQHVFEVRNTGDAALDIERIQPT
jgi:hypothetical protein